MSAMELIRKSLIPIILKWRSALLTEYYLCDQIMNNEIGGAGSTYGGEERSNGVLVGKPQGKRPLGKPTRRWKDNIIIDLQGVG
jgi:hypothetical protein